MSGLEYFGIIPVAVLTVAMALFLSVLLYWWSKLFRRRAPKGKNKN